LTPLGFETSEAAVVEIGEIEALLVRRFDRALDRDGRVARLHQEDFAQALGLPAALKYERRGTPRAPLRCCGYPQSPG
jgi:serine/threonine-protein kinase HipA